MIKINTKKIIQVILLIVFLWSIPNHGFAQFGAEYSSYGFNFVNDANNDGLDNWTGEDIGNTSKINIYKQSALNNYALELKAQNDTVLISYDDAGYIDINPCSFVINLRLNIPQYTGNQDGFSFMVRTGSKLIALQFKNTGIYYLNSSNTATLITTAPPVNQWLTYTIALDGCAASGSLVIENDVANTFPLSFPDNTQSPFIELYTHTNGSTLFETEIDHFFIYSNPTKWWLGPSTPYGGESNYVGTTGDRQHYLTLPNGERVGINENGGGYMTYTQLSPTGDNLYPNPKFGSGGTKTLRGYFHSSDYNPVQAGASSTTGGHLVTVNTTANQLDIPPFPLHLYYKSGVTENNLLTFPSGETMTDFDNSTHDDDVYDEFGLDMRHEIITELDFSSTLDNVSSASGISVVRHRAEWEFIRHPCQLLQYHEPDANPRFDLNGSPHSDSDMGEMRHKFEFRMNKDLGYEWVLWRENGQWNSLNLTTVGQAKTYSSTTPASISIESRLMVFSTSNSLTDPNAIAWYYPESVYNANCTVQKSRVDKSVVSQEDRRFKVQITADWRKTNWCRMNLYIFNKGLLAPNHGNQHTYETFQMEAYQLFGTPTEIWSEVQGIALPIELTNFDAMVTAENQVKLQWVTASEVNNDFFTIERSKDGTNWEAIKKINGAGNSIEHTNYSTIDAAPLEGTSLYRLKQTDYDGKYTFSPIKSVLVKNIATPKLTVFPNPTNGIVTVELNDIVVKSLRILDNLGHDLTAKTEHLSDNEQYIQLNLNQFPKGQYYLIINNSIVHLLQRK